MNLAERLPRRFTYADYCRWPEEERWELIDGEAWDMSPAPNPLHQEVSGRLFYRLNEGRYGAAEVFGLEDGSFVSSRFPELEIDLLELFDAEPAPRRQPE